MFTKESLILSKEYDDCTSGAQVKELRCVTHYIGCLPKK